MSTIDDVKAALDIVEVVQGYVPALKRMGRSWKAPCPFHSERTPSFVVDPERRTWHCFGACSTGGDVIGFVQRFEHLEFRDALKRCADRAGIELRAPTPRETREREVHERLLRANEAAAVFYQAALTGPAGAHALAYAESRGLDQAARDTWQIGYAPDEWRALTDHLLARGFTEQDLMEAGLSVRSQGPADSGPSPMNGRGQSTAPAQGEREGSPPVQARLTAEAQGRIYDRFRDRLIYPTRDPRGRMIGFGARALQPGQEPKYLNTPQTPLFDKSGTLYGLDRAGEEARRAGRMVVVEGYMDVIGCHQAGIRNVVASQGTSITEKQMTLLQRYAHDVVLMLDADAAGSAAALRGVGVAAGAAERGTVATVDWRGLVSYQDVLKADIRVVALPAGEDPDSLVRSDPERLRALLNAARPVADHLFEAVGAETDAADPRARSRAVEALAPTVAAIADPVVRAHYIQRLARLGQVEEHTVLAMLARAAGAARAVPSRAEAAQVTRQARTAAAPPDGETQLLHLLLLRPEARFAGLALDPDVFEDTTNRRLFEAWCSDESLTVTPSPLVGEGGGEGSPLDDDVVERLTALRASATGTWDPASIDAKHIAPRVEEIARLLRLRRAQSRLVPAALAHATEVAQARRAGTEDTDALTAEFAEMDARQRALSRRARGYVEETVPTDAS